MWNVDLGSRFRSKYMYMIVRVTQVNVVICFVVVNNGTWKEARVMVGSARVGLVICSRGDRNTVVYLLVDQ